MKEGSKKSYVTIFPECETIHLKKDVGMLPFSMGNYEGYNFKIVTYDEKDFSILKMKEYHIEQIKKKQGVIPDFLKYIIENAKYIDVLNLYHITSYRNIYWILCYKLCNPHGKIHIKLDADYRMLDIFEPFPTNIKGKVRNYIFRKFVDLYTVETTEMLNVLRDAWNLDCKLLPNGIFVDNNILMSDFAEGDNVFLTVGRLGTEQKATDILLEAFKNIANVVDWNLILVGPIEKDFNAVIDCYFKDNPSLKSRVRFEGNISNEVSLVKFYEKAKVFVLPSRWESFGLVLLEALERGDFIITTDKVPTAGDISCDGRNCEIVPVDDVEALSEAMIKATRQKISGEIRHQRSEWTRKNYSWEKIAEILNMYLQG